MKYNVTIPEWTEGVPLVITNVEAACEAEARAYVVAWVNRRAGLDYCAGLPAGTGRGGRPVTLAEFAALVEKATPPPWTARLYLNGQWGIAEFRLLERPGEQVEADARFAAAARAWVPKLLAVAEAARAFHAATLGAGAVYVWRRREPHRAQVPLARRADGPSRRSRRRRARSRCGRGRAPSATRKGGAHERGAVPVRSAAPLREPTVGGRSWRVPKHYIALHGLRARAWELPALGFAEVSP